MKDWFINGILQTVMFFINQPQKCTTYSFWGEVHVLWLPIDGFVPLFCLGNRRGAGHAVTNILAKELLQEDTKPSTTAKKNRLDSESKKAESVEDTGSLEDLLDDAPLRSS